MSLTDTQRYLRAMTEHYDTCPIAIRSLDEALFGGCPICSELHARASASMNGYLHERPPLLDQAAWDAKLEGHRAYCRNNRKDGAYLDDPIYASPPPLPEGVGDPLARKSAR
jgi:hypothetical protein